MRYATRVLAMMAVAAVIGTTTGASEGRGEPKADFLRLTDEVPDSRWRMIEGKDDPAGSAAEFRDGTILLSGSCMQEVEIESTVDTAFDGQVSFFITPGTHQEWESASLTLFGESTDTRAYFMVIFGKPGRQGNQCEVGLYPDQMLTKDLPAGEWYTLKVSMAGGGGRMKVWPKQAPEPAEWDARLYLPGHMDKVTGVGLRTYGPAVQYDDFDFSTKAYKPIALEDQGLKVELTPAGQIARLTLPSGDQDEIQFRRTGYHSGPAWIVDGKRIRLSQSESDQFLFSGKQDDVRYSIEYRAVGQALAIIAGLRNEGEATFKPDAARLMLGINTEMIRYPDWNDKFFPTLIRGERTHLWGYFMSPAGRVLTLSCPDPIASWNYEYQPRRHRIYTVSLDMLHKLPLPRRHPQDKTQLLPGQEQSWTLYLEEVDAPGDVKAVVSRNVDAPMFDMDRYTIADGEQSAVSIISGAQVDLTITDPSGRSAVVKPGTSGSNGVYHYTLRPQSGIGRYTLRAENRSGRITEASVYVRHPWSWYLKQARKEAIRIPQKASTHAEAWLGHYSAMAARRYFPDEKLDALANDNFRTILPLMYDLKTGAQIVHSGRIQNSYYMFGLLADSCRTTGNIEDLELASKIADWLMNFQTPDGAYRNGNTHYTSVAYGAKSMLELAATERELAATSGSWKQRYERHYNSAKAAIRELERNRDNIQTEGQMTYEDGMIGCSATQLALWALLQKDAAERATFLNAARSLFDGHRCLDQMLVPDSRYHGGTLRFWEVQYDVMIPHNMMNSPHGWTAWRIPGFCYMYQLTGEEEWLRRAMNSLGSCVQLIDGETGILRHSFTQDPYIETTKLIADPDNPDNNAGIRVHTIIGEQYIDMISHFYKPRDFNVVYGGHWGEAGCCDNDVHEVFKALEEVALTAAYVIERADGSWSTYNCRADMVDGTLHIVPAEDVVSRIHLNLKHQHNMKATFGTGETAAGSYSGMQWIGPGGVPEDLRIK